MTATDDRAPLRIDEWPYVQIADRLEKRIRGGEFGTDGKLPSTRALADWYGVSPSVVMHARQVLWRRNLVVQRHRIGYFVRPQYKAGLDPPQGSRRPGTRDRCPVGGGEREEW